MSTESRSADTPQIFTPEYYERMHSLESGSWWNAGMRDLALLLLEWAGIPRSGRMLDVGCGSGQTLRWFLRHFSGWGASGLDVSGEALKVARRNGQRTVTQSSALALPYADSCIDLVICLDVLQHLPIPDGDTAALGEIRRVLKPGGHFLVRTNAQAFPRIPDDLDKDFHKYEPSELRLKFTEAGLEPLRLSRVNAVLGWAEIPRELRARRRQGARYHGILSTAGSQWSWSDHLKRKWLNLEGQLVKRGWRLPSGRSILGLCRA